MISFLTKWVLASLCMPILVLLFGRVLNQILVLLFWPGSIALMSLGSEEKPWSQVIYTWLIAVGLNVLLYVILGVVVYFVMRLFKAS
jgi:hypothetical protein